MKKVIHEPKQPFIYLCNKCNSICSIQILNSYQTKICIDCHDKDEEIITIQEYLERINKLSNEGNKCEKHSEKLALDICLNCQKWMCDKCKKEHLRNKKYKKHLITNSIIEFLSKCPSHLKNLKYYCKDCDDNCCELCINKHKGHAYGPMMLTKMEQNITKRKEELNKAIQNMKQNIDDLYEDIKCKCDIIQREKLSISYKACKKRNDNIIKVIKQLFSFPFVPQHQYYSNIMNNTDFEINLKVNIDDLAKINNDILSQVIVYFDNYSIIG